MSGRLVLTVDLDRDVNLPLEGSIAAGSIDRGDGTSPRFTSAERGLRILLDILDDIGMRATFFVEGRTAETIDCSSLSGHCIGFHGYDHEDLLGRSTGVGLSDDDLVCVLRRGFDAVSDNASRPVCFRAPYMSCDDRILSTLVRMGVGHDSSTYSDPGTQPYEIVQGMVEHPVFECKDPSGKRMAAYLWPMHEGKRSPDDYIWMASESEGGDFILATHTWHMVERRSSGPMGEDDVRDNAEDVRRLLEGMIDLGLRPDVMVR